MPENQEARTDIIKSVALLVLDAQDVFIDTIYNKESFLLRTAFAIEAARSLRIATIFTEQAPEKLGRTNRKLHSLAWKPKTFAKHSFSALKAPGLERYLRDNEIYHLIVCGLETPICIYQTALQAEEEDIDITFLTDALGGRRQEDEGPVLEALRKMSCELLPSETLFYSLLGGTDHPYFRFLNSVVKSYNNKAFDQEEFAKQTFAPSQDSPQREEEVEPKQEQEKPVSNDTDKRSPWGDDNSDQSSNKRRNRNRRNRGRNRGRRDDYENNTGNSENHRSSDEQPKREQPAKTEAFVPSRPAPEYKEDNSQRKESSPSNESDAPSKPIKPKKKAAPVKAITEAAPPKSVSRSSSNDPNTADSKPAVKKVAAKKAAKKVARKTAAKKAAKKVAKKVTKKVAKKAVKKTAPSTSTGND